MQVVLSDHVISQVLGVPPGANNVGTVITPTLSHVSVVLALVTCILTQNDWRSP